MRPDLCRRERLRRDLGVTQIRLKGDRVEILAVRPGREDRG